MTILSAIQDACVNVALAVPTAVFSSTEREHVELASIANSVALQIAKSYDWQALKTIATVTGDASTEDFDLPSDYSRQLMKTTLWVASRPFYPLQHVLDTDLWLGIVTSTASLSLGQWTIYGSQVHIRPALALADTAKYFYITNKIVHPATGANKAAFTIDTDTFLLDEEVLELGIIVAWKQLKGLPYGEDMESYEIALSEAIGRDKGSKILVVGTQRYPNTGDMVYAFPGTITP